MAVAAVRLHPCCLLQCPGSWTGWTRPWEGFLGLIPSLWGPSISGYSIIPSFSEPKLSTHSGHGLCYRGYSQIPLFLANPFVLTVLSLLKPENSKTSQKAENSHSAPAGRNFMFSTGMCSEMRAVLTQAGLGMAPAGIADNLPLGELSLDFQTIVNPEIPSFWEFSAVQKSTFKH